MRTLTGITPSGTLHIGNYFGAMRPAIEAQARGECYYFIADYHSMTAVSDAAERRRNTLGVAVDWLACGLDPAKSVFWRQSDVPEVCELTWLLGSLTPMGLLERAHSYKDKTAKGISPNFGLFAYPVLMAADILLYDTNVVPVGQDQKQHLEMTRDIAIKFNQTYGETFVVPEAEIRARRGRRPRARRPEDEQELRQHHRDLRRRKGAAQEGHVDRDGQPPARRSRSRTRTRTSRSSSSGSSRPPAVAADYEDRLRAGGLGYGDLKKALFEHYWNYFAAGAGAPGRAARRPGLRRADPARRAPSGPAPWRGGPRARPQGGRPRLGAARRPRTGGGSSGRSPP